MEALFIKTAEKKNIGQFEDNWVMCQLKELKKIDESKVEDRKKRIK